MRRAILFSLLFLGCHAVMAQDYNVLDYGADPEGIELSTASIQKAVDEANANGGGRVVIPQGQFLSGSIVLKSGVDLHIEGDGTLLGSTNPDHYIKMNWWKALIMADNQNNVSVTGEGTIDGQGRALALHVDSLYYIGQLDSSKYNFVEMRPREPYRPQILEFVRCTNIKVLNVTLRNSSSWVQTYDKCEGLLIDSMTVDSDAYWNNDGIDISDCRNVRITNCNINAADDGICLKSHAFEFTCDSIYIGQCIVRSSASAIKFGTRSYGGFRNVVIEDIKVYDTFRSAIAIETVDGGILEDVLVNNIHAINTGNALFIRLGHRYQKDEPAPLRNVTIRNMKVEIAFERPDYNYEIRGPELPFFHNTFPASITGIPGYPVENVTLENIEIVYPGRGNRGLAYAPISRLSDIPEREADYPEFSMFGELPAWGLYVRHVKGLTMRNIKLTIEHPDYRPSMVFDDVMDLTLGNILIDGDAKDTDLVLKNTSNDSIDSSMKVLRLK